MEKPKLKFSREIGGNNIGEVLDDGLRAEKLGFDQVWVPDHLVDINPVFAIYDAWTFLSYLGAKTSKLRLASGVTDIQRIHPAKTANIVSTLDKLTGGRAVLGIGAGEIMNTVPYGIPWEQKKDRLKRFREYLKVILLLWSSSYENPVSFEGNYYSLKNAFLSLAASQKPHPPIYIGSFSSRSTLRLVGELSDGWYPGSLNSLQSYKSKLEFIKEGAREAKRSIDSIDIVAGVPTFLCENDSEMRAARAECKQAVLSQMLSNQYIFKIFGLNPDDFLSKELRAKLEYQLATPGKQFDSDFKKAFDSISIPQEVLEKAIDDTMVIGNLSTCVERVMKFVEAGATQIFFSNIGAKQENYERIGAKVIPQIKSEI